MKKNWKTPLRRTGHFECCLANVGPVEHRATMLLPLSHEGGRCRQLERGGEKAATEEKQCRKEEKKEKLA